jgi:hypothetical protein
MAVLVGLADGAKGLAEIPPIVVLAGLVHVGEDDENLLVGIAGEGVGSQFRDVEAKLLHVLLEGLLPIEGVLQDGLLDLEHLAFGGPLGGGRDCIEELRETVFVNPLPYGVPSVCFETLSVMADSTMEAMASTAPFLVPMVAWIA